MANLHRQVKRLEGDIKDTIKWAASLYDYLRETRGRLMKLQDILELPRIMEAMNSSYQGARASLYDKHGETRGRLLVLQGEARRSLRSALRSQAKMARFYGKAKKTMKRIADKDAPEFGAELRQLQQRLRPHEAVLTREASFFKGELRDDFKELGATLELLRQKQLNAPVEAQRPVLVMVEKINRVIAERGFSTGLVPFIAVLTQNAKPYVEELKQQLKGIRKAA